VVIIVILLSLLGMMKEKYRMILNVSVRKFIKISVRNI